ncbi:hypothetical protein F4825DRAFT_281278 [Nemania diffusa]|nr:hypothetical protein F4825DRAFT_281278 [Nemania diffusa]
MMSSHIPDVVVHVFPLIFLCGLYLVSSLMVNSGHAEAFAQSLDHNPYPVLPDGKTPLRTVYTGFSALDSYLANLQLIFIPLVDGSCPELSLLGWHWAGLLLALSSVVLIENLRSRKLTGLVTFSLWGLCVQYCGYFTTMPLYCYFYLLRSSHTASAAVYSEHDILAVRSVPLSVLLGFVVPSVVMCLPQIHSGHSRQLAVAFWQNFPLWIALAQIPAMWRASRHTRQSDVAILAQSKKYSSTIKQVYKIVGVASLLVHVSGLLPIVLAVVWPEGLVSALSRLGLNERSLQSLRPHAFFLPARWDSQVQINNMAEGAMNFLRYDYIVGTAAALLWAVLIQHRQSQKNLRSHRVASSKNKSYTGRGVKQAFKICASSVACGPGFTILDLMSQREDSLLDSSKQRQG